MAYLLQPKKQQPIFINPINEDQFSRDELLTLLQAKELTFYDVLNQNGKATPYKMAFNAALMCDIHHFNLLATRAYLRGKYDARTFSLYCISMRLNIQDFTEHYQNINFISGLAIIGTHHQMRVI